MILELVFLYAIIYTITLNMTTPDLLPLELPVTLVSTDQIIVYNYYKTDSKYISSFAKLPFDIEIETFLTPPDEIHLIFEDDKTTFWQYKLPELTQLKDYDISIKTGLEQNQNDYTLGIAIGILILSIIIISSLLGRKKIMKDSSKNE